MDKLKGLEKIMFKDGKFSPSKQFSKKFVKSARDKFRGLGYASIDSNIFNVGDGVYCFGVRSRFEVSKNHTNLTIEDIGYNGEKLAQEQINDVFSEVVDELNNRYDISTISYK